jgi:hypothetical protein
MTDLRICGSGRNIDGSTTPLHTVAFLFENPNMSAGISPPRSIEDMGNDLIVLKHATSVDLEWTVPNKCVQGEKWFLKSIK